MKLSALPIVTFSALAASMTSVLFCATAAFAGTLPSPTGPVILTITGKIANTNDGHAAKFDRAMLEKLGMKNITTSSPWYDSKVTFTGVPFDAVMKDVGATGTTIKAIALNDYETEIPMSDLGTTGVILALKLNGEIMSVRDKGPIFVIYPYDSSSELQSQTYYARSAWQVSRFDVQ